ncbi:glycogen synthase [Candidatus Venteria ishoeyi]|uniref:glycogen synthase n=1 Tax=Candidatus Venteria ishoeyi TaxID=1899563 RepID=UPI0025A4D1DE|nr:glycogen synthase [Candidatus Venteria ishoeyi]MDM8545553.1 glycogen synthase [Candidatus Venteria ishoeyi]
MYIIMVASECAPVAKVGGLADVVHSLSGELDQRGHTVEIILPKYDCMRYDHIYDLQIAYRDLWVPWYGGAIHCTVWFGFSDGRRCFFIEPHSQDNYFNRNNFYGFHDEVMRFAFFSKAALEFMLKTNKRPDIIHAHDWQTGLLPVLLYELYQYHGMQQQRVCYTIHNFKHQGVCDEEVLWASGLQRPEYYGNRDRLGDDFSPRRINLMKGGIVYANYANTVSPTHAWEARHTEQGYGLGHILHVHQHKFGGILNGLDYEAWNPETDTLLPHNYTVNNLDGKYANKIALCNRLLLEEAYKPIIAYIGRLDTQKGIALIRHSLFYALDNGAQFVLLGSSPEARINDEFWKLKFELNDNPDCHLEIGFNEELAHLIYAGSDMVVVPSLYEPCGLTQLIALRYGTVPIVRAIGGLADTVFDWNDEHKSPNPNCQRNGYVFYDATPEGLESALHRAIGLWNSHPDIFRRLLVHGMKCDYSWKQSVQNYLNAYEHISVTKV